jgi:hypothetical protein
MPSIINLSSIDWNGKEVQSFAEATFEKVFEKPEVNLFHTIQEGIVAKQQIIFLGLLTKVTKLDAGCSSSPTNGSIATSQKFWDPETVEIWQSECYSNLEGSFMVYAKKLGIAQPDLTGTTWAQFMSDRLTDAMAEDLFRIVWFNDKNAANYDDSPAGKITNGVALTDYNIINGLFKQLDTIISADADRLVNIAENENSTYATQDALATDRAFLVFNALSTKCDYRLRTQPDRVIIATQSLVDNYLNFLESKSLVFSLVEVQNGITEVKYRGQVIYGFNFWDRTIRADFDNGTKWDNPHRALYTTKSNIVVGVDAASAVSEFDVWYERKDKTTNMRGNYKIDAKILEDYLVQYAV